MLLAVACTMSATIHHAQLQSAQLQTLHNKRFVVVPRFLSDSLADRLRVDAIACDSLLGFDCCVGSAGGGARLDQSVRRSRQCHLYPPPPNSAGSASVRAELIDIVLGLRQQLQACATLALPRLEPFETELSYLLYPIGGHYIRHLDIPAKQDAGWRLQGRSAAEGGSFTGGRTRRVVSFILYLNRMWPEGDGGELRVFQARDSSTRQHSSRAHDIAPEGGTLVVMMSGDVEHLVRETHAQRQCIVGWFNEYRQERVPDRDTFGASTRGCP